MASYQKRGKKYLVRWRDPDGVERNRTVPDLQTAKELAREVERVTGLGRRWEPEDADPLPALIEGSGSEVTGGAFHDFMAVARGMYVKGTVRHYDRALRGFLVHLQRQHPHRRRLTVDLLTRDAVQTWFGVLREALTVSTARLYVGAVYAAWEWLEDSDKYGNHVGRVRRFTMPSPTTTPAAAPSWEQMDKCIAAALRLAEEDETPQGRRGYAWRSKLLILLRFTGMRVDEQAMQLRWEDVDLDNAEITIRGELGKSAQERTGRVIPLSPHLVEAMAGWGQREGYVLAPWRRDRHSTSAHIVRCWQEAKAPERIWKEGGGRKRGQAHHAFRKGFKTGLMRLGADRDVRDYLLGHHRGIDENYIETLEQARDAVQQLPPLACDHRVISLEKRREETG